MRILALDLGSKCGWAFNQPKLKASMCSGVWNLQPTKFDSAGVRYKRFQDHLEIELALGSVEKVMYEAVRNHMAIDAAHVYGGMVAILQTVCIKHDIPYEGVAVATIKKHATGKGNADKKAMVKAAVRKFKSVNVIDDNHADALHLLDYAVSKI